MSADTVFFAWQDDLTPKYNRYLIKDALIKAIAQLNRELSVVEAEREDDGSESPRWSEIQYDEATAGVPGWPEIGPTILEKIARCRLFLADISIVNRECDCPKPTANANVLLELGYALAARSRKNVLCVVNMASLRSGKLEELPFDIRRSRPITYTCTGDEDKSAALKDLIGKLKTALSCVLLGGVIGSLIEFFEQTNPAIMLRLAKGESQIPVAIADSRYRHLADLLRSPECHKYATVTDTGDRMGDHTNMAARYIHDREYGARAGYLITITPAFLEEYSRSFKK